MRNAQGREKPQYSTTVINRRPKFHCAQRGSKSLKYLCLVTEAEMIINAGCKARSKEPPEFLCLLATLGPILLRIAHSQCPFTVRA